jgi:hypothetical protein
MMRIQEMVKPALFGVLGGAVAAVVAGTSMGLLVTSGTASEQANLKSARAVAAVMTPYCVAAAQADPNYATLFEEMKAGTSYQRTQIVTKAGWATPMGATGPNATLANVCQQKLTETV